VLAVVDTGPLYAAVDADDQDHRRSLDALQMPGLRLFIPAMVVAETAYLVGSRIGSAVEAAFLAGLSDFDVVAPAPEDWERIAQLVDRYGDFPLGGTDASVIVLAERLNANVLVTLDRRHFAVVRPSHCPTWHILPE